MTKAQKKKSPDLQTIAASFNGITGVLTSFHHIVQEKQLEEIFKDIIVCCSPNVEARRHAMQTSVLKLLSTHTNKFKGYFFKDNVKLLDFLVKMLGSVKNAGLRSCVCSALSALVLEVQ